MCINVEIQELEGAWFGAGGLNPPGFVSSKCVFPPVRVSHKLQVTREPDTGTGIPSTSNTSVGEMCPGYTAGVWMG